MRSPSAITKFAFGNGISCRLLKIATLTVDDGNRDSPCSAFTPFKGLRCSAVTMLRDFCSRFFEVVTAGFHATKW